MDGDVEANPGPYVESLDDRESFTLLRHVYNLVLQHFDRGTPNIDAFADAANAQTERYWSSQEDSFSKSWNVHDSKLI